MSFFLAILLVASAVCGAAGGNSAAVTAAALEGADRAIQLTLSMTGVLCLWNGVLHIWQESGVTALLSHLLAPLLTRLFPRAGQDKETLAQISANVSANLLGLGNAATAPGIRAAQRMAAGCGGVAGNELCLLVVLNTASIQLLPTTVAALRTAAGCTTPLDILPAVWLTSLCSVTVGLAAARLLSRFSGGNRP